MCSVECLQLVVSFLSDTKKKIEVGEMKESGNWETRYVHGSCCVLKGVGSFPES